MKTILKESLFEQQDENLKSSVNIENEMNYFVDIEHTYEDDKETLKEFSDAIEEFGVDKSNIGILASFGTSANWDAIEKELDRRQIEYYEFETLDGEMVILFNINDIQSEKNEKDFKRQ